MFPSIQNQYTHGRADGGGRKNPLASSDAVGASSLRAVSA
jgi:hypothetical protein